MMKFTSILLLASVFFASCGSPDAAKEEKKPEPIRPNILIIVADDLGFSDVQPFGGNIRTPVIGKLAQEGLSFSGFHVLPTCSPTRSALLTGNDNHVAGLGIMHEMDYPALQSLQLPGYSGNLSDQTVTIAELLGDAGYHTYMTGKWHLGEGAGHDPHDRGFQQSFILGTGGGSHWADRKALAPPQHMDYTYNGKVVDPPADFYSSKNYTDSMLSFIDRNKADKKPFFAYLSYTAVHDPLHVPKEYIAKYKGAFNMGWDSLYAQRLSNLQALGIVPQGPIKSGKNPMIPAWSKLPKHNREELARDMEVYAGMLDYMDSCIGVVFEYLKKEGLYDNTMILFMSDNGANGAVATTYPGNADGKYLASFNNRMDNRGLPNSYVEMGPGWAQASTAPFRFFKTFASEGGIKAPLIIKAPGAKVKAGSWNASNIHVTDIMPTILELAGAAYPAQFKGRNVHPLIGRSIMPILQGDSVSVNTNHGMGWELFEMKAYIYNNWKILRQPKPFGTGEWQLFDLSKDPSEANDLSAQNPELRTQLIEAWKVYAKENQLHDHNGHYDSVYLKSYSAGKEND